MWMGMEQSLNPLPFPGSQVFIFSICKCWLHYPVQQKQAERRMHQGQTNQTANRRRGKKTDERERKLCNASSLLLHLHSCHLQSVSALPHLLLLRNLSPLFWSIWNKTPQTVPSFFHGDWQSLLSRMTLVCVSVHIHSSFIWIQFSLSLRAPFMFKLEKDPLKAVLGTTNSQSFCIATQTSYNGNINFEKVPIIQEELQTHFSMWSSWVFALYFNLNPSTDIWGSIVFTVVPFVVLAVALS